MDEWWLRASHNFAARLDGPFHLRFILQPLMSLVFAFRDGVRDARSGGPAYLWCVFTDSDRRPALLQSGWKSVGRIFLIALAIDVVYQIIALRTFYPGEALLTSVLLAVVPYALLRGPINRIARELFRARSVSSPAR
jgi:hypothetical protein